MSIEQGKISESQWMFLVTGFTQGSILLISFTTGITKHDNWLVVLSGLIVATPFVACYAFLAKRFPGMGLVQINDIVYGKYLGKIISLYYIFFFFVTASLNFRDLGDFYTIFLMTDTPLIFFLVVYVAVCAFAISKGIEVLARIGHLFVATAFLVSISTFLLLLNRMDFSNFLPVFELPFIRFVQGTHVISNVPFGETVVFLAIMPALNRTKHVVKNTVFGLVLGGITILIIAVRNTAVLGNVETILVSSSFQAARLIDLGNIFTRMDILIGIGQTILLFLKCSLFYYALVISLGQLLRLRSYLPLILPVGGIEVILAVIIFQSPIDHTGISISSGIIYSVPLLYIFPPLSLLLAGIRGLPKQERVKKV